MKPHAFKPAKKPQQIRGWGGAVVHEMALCRICGKPNTRNSHSEIR